MIDLLAPALWLPPKPAIIRPAEFKRADRIAKAMPWTPGFIYSHPPPPATRTNTANTQSTSFASTYTFSSQSLGTPVGTSLVVVCVHVLSSGVAGTVLSTVSIDGTNGTIHQNANSIQSGGGGVITAIASRATSNTTGAIVVTLNATMVACRIEIYRLNNLVSATVYGGNKVQSTSGSVTSQSSTMNIPANGVGVACATWYGAFSGPSLSAGITQDAAGNITGSGYYVNGSNQSMTVQTGRTVTAAGVAGWAGTAFASWQ